MSWAKGPSEGESFTGLRLILKEIDRLISFWNHYSWAYCAFYWWHGNLSRVKRWTKLGNVYDIRFEYCSLSFFGRLKLVQQCPIIIQTINFELIGISWGKSCRSFRFNKLDISCSPIRRALGIWIDGTAQRKSFTRASPYATHNEQRSRRTYTMQNAHQFVEEGKKCDVEHEFLVPSLELGEEMSSTVCVCRLTTHVYPQFHYYCWTCVGSWEEENNENRKVLMIFTYFTFPSQEWTHILSMTLGLRRN